MGCLKNKDHVFSKIVKWTLFLFRYEIYIHMFYRNDLCNYCSLGRSLEKRSREGERTRGKVQYQDTGERRKTNHINSVWRSNLTHAVL